MSTLLSRLKAREIRGVRGHHDSSSSSKWYYPRIPDRLVVPIKSLIRSHNAELLDTVLLGFLKDGKHLVGYTACEFEDEDDFSSGFLCTYKLSLWRFDDKTVSEHAPLQNVFECYLFDTDEEPLAVSGFQNICVTELSENLLCVHGWQRGEGEASEHYVTLVSPPKHNWEWSEQCVVTTKFEYHGVPDNGWEVAYVGGAAPTLALNTGGSLAYHRINISKESKEGTKLSLGSRVLVHLDKNVQWLMVQNKQGRNKGVLDLDVRIVGTSEEYVFFNLSILYQYTGPEANPMVPSWLRRSAIFSLCPSTGKIECRRVSVPLFLIPSTNDQAKSMRNWFSSPPYQPLHRLSNSSAVTGESLTYLYHPIYPLAIRGYSRTKSVFESNPRGPDYTTTSMATEPSELRSAVREMILIIQKISDNTGEARDNLRTMCSHSTSVFNFLETTGHHDKKLALTQGLKALIEAVKAKDPASVNAAITNIRLLMKDVVNMVKQFNTIATEPQHPKSKRNTPLPKRAEPPESRPAVTFPYAITLANAPSLHQDFKRTPEPEIRRLHAGTTTDESTKDIKRVPHLDYPDLRRSDSTSLESGENNNPEQGSQSVNGWLRLITYLSALQAEAR